MSRPFSWGNEELGFISKGNIDNNGLNHEGMCFDHCFCIRMSLIRLGINLRVSIGANKDENIC